MLKYLTKISMDIFPSVLATIIGAYIVNHYINTKPSDPAAVAVAPADARKPAPATTDVAHLPPPGVKAKGISEKSVQVEKSAVESHVDKPDSRPADPKASETKASETKASETKASYTKAADAKAGEAKPGEATAATEMRRHQPSLRERALARISPPPTAAPAAPVAVEAAAAAAAPEDRRDAADLARAAIERLRKSPETSPAPEPARTEAARGQETARVVAAPSALRPLPPPITVSAPPAETYGPANQPGMSPNSAGTVQQAERPTPPAEIPVPVVTPPLDLRAEATGTAGPRERTNVAEDMLSGVKSIFHTVLPKNASPE